MKITNIAFGLGLLLAVSSFTPSPAWAQKIILIKTGTVAVIIKPVRVRKFGRVTHKRLIRKPGIPRLRFTSISFPEQTLFPPYYQHPRPWAEGPDMASRIEGGKTVRQGSMWRSYIKGGKTVEQGAPTRSRITDPHGHYKARAGP